MIKNIFMLFCFLTLLGCGTSKKAVQGPVPNPAAEGFNATGSDAQAIALADEVMTGMGGRQNWNDTRFLRWNFFGKRTLTWDLHLNRARIDIPGRNLLILVNADNGTGKVRQGGLVLQNPDSVAYYLEMGRQILINDSYWLVMPFKLKDKGVTLKYLGAGNSELGFPQERIQLTFDQVGVTPENKYVVYINPGSKMVTQWDFYTQATDSLPSIVTPWQDYRPVGQIFLSSGRGKAGTLSPLSAPKVFPDAVFTDFAEPDWNTLLAAPTGKKKKVKLPHPAKAIK